MSGWWRRNGWAVPTAVIAFALAGVPGAADYHQSYRNNRPEEAVRPAADGWATYAGARVRLVSAGQVAAADLAERSVELPGGTTAWRATLEFDVSGTDGLGGCTLQARGAAGAGYSAGPIELSRLRGALAGCMPDSDHEGQPVFGNTPVFLLPATDHPVSVRIMLATQLPRFVELPVPARQG